MKKISALFLSLFLLASVFSSVHAAEKSLTVWLNGEQIQFNKSEPLVEKGVTLVPMRPLLEKLEVKVNWNEATRTASGTKEGLSLSLQIGNTNATANGKTVKLDAAPKQISNVTYVPLRFIAETTGYKVAWDSSLRQVALTSEQQAEGSRGFLWKVENKGNTVYLLGSIHVAKEKMYPLRQEIEDAFEAADYLGVEIDLSTIDPQQAQKLVLDLGAYKDGTQLKDHISAETYAKVTAFLKANDYPETSFDNFKPWLITQNISNIQAAKAGYQTEIGIDMYLIQNANKVKKPILSLESIESQLQMFNNFSDPLQEKLLLQTLEPASEDTPAPGEGLDLLTKMWIEGDDAVLAELTKASAWDDEYYKGMLSDRNEGMVEHIKSYLNSDKKETYMVVVGALHMLGDHGVVTLLEKEGFTLARQ
ncbi:TraB/GumN family protein [Paenibacillus sp. GCM10012307]|uniref:TraB/GumN family protein n=1 Tax=Paenibacillus roseus TaxID=2798579 RepID=A0A934J7R2_9BACL|nr:TraB/GumN family protein [Paenibacillus roseus]MBJ6361843.1 TraB/GumN family protein [Paenibacillus roseus]